MHAVHGNAKSGRARDHHFVHTSLKLQLKGSRHQRQTRVLRTTASRSNICTSGYFSARANTKHTDNDIALEFVEIDTSTHDQHERAHKNNHQAGSQEQVALDSIDITKAVTFSLDILTRARGALRAGLRAIFAGMDALDNYRRQLFSEQEGKINQGLELIKSVADTVKWIEDKMTRFAESTADPNSPEGQKMMHEIKFIAALRMKQLNKQVQNGANFFVDSVAKELDKLNQYPEILLTNLKPLTDLLATMMQVDALLNQ